MPSSLLDGMCGGKWEGGGAAVTLPLFPPLRDSVVHCCECDTGSSKLEWVRDAGSLLVAGQQRTAWQGTQSCRSDTGDRLYHEAYPARCTASRV